MFIIRLMKKKLPLIIIGAVIIVGAILFFLVFNKPAKNTESVDNITTESENSFSGSMKDLIGIGKSQKCTYENSTGKGTLFVSPSGKVRGDFETYDEGKTSFGHIIADGDISYFWTDGETSGMKIVSETSPDSSENGSDFTSAQYSGSGFDGDYSYKCSAWITDESKFTPPGDMKFQSIEEMMSNFSSQ